MKKRSIVLLLCITVLFGCAAKNPLNKGLEAGRLRDYSAMLKYCTKATKKANPDPFAFKCVGDAQLNLGRRQQAEEAYLTYLAKMPNDSDVRLIIIDLYFNSGRYSAAQAQLEFLLSLQPGNVQGLYFLGELHRLTNNCEAALIAYDKALLINPNYSQATLGKQKTEKEVCLITEKKQSTPAPKVIKKKKFEGGGAALDESDW